MEIGRISDAGRVDVDCGAILGAQVALKSKRAVAGFAARREGVPVTTQVYEGHGFELWLSPPGPRRFDLPEDHHYLDIGLGGGRCGYTIVGLPGAPTEAPPNSFVFLPAGSAAQIIAQSTGWSVQFCVARQQGVWKTVGAADALSTRVLLHERDDALIGICQVLKTVWESAGDAAPRGHYDAVAQLLLVRLGHHLADNVSDRPSRAPVSKRISRVLAHIDENLADLLSVQDLAVVAGMSPYHFARVFRAEMSRSPHKYVVERRIERARQFLSQSEDGIAQIALMCGFGSQSHMTQVFSKTLGTTPGAIRRIGH
ncbi:MAG: AraC family transcriptional regulator [Pseudomonadota bacterium]